MQREDTYRQQFAPRTCQHFVQDDLSEREIEVLREVAGGRSDKTITSHPSISGATVKAHVKNISLLLGASDRTHAVSIATAHGELGASLAERKEWLRRFPDVGIQ